MIVPNSGVWGQPSRNFSIYPAPPHAGEMRFQTPEGTDLVPAIERVHRLVSADPRVLADPAPSVLLDRPAGDALEIVVGFYTTEYVAALVKKAPDQGRSRTTRG